MSVVLASLVAGLQSVTEMKGDGDGREMGRVREMVIMYRHSLSMKL